jgi:hypothetical protein
MRVYLLYNFNIYVSSREDEMGGSCSEHGEMRNAYKFLLECLKEREHSEDVGVGGRVILKLILGK